MTPDQLARLTLLLSMATLAASEEQELTFLKSIATPDELATAGASEDPDDDDDEEEEEEETAPPAADPKATKPGVFDHAKAMAMSKASLVARNRELTEKTGRLTADLAKANAAIKAGEAKLAATTKELAAVKQMLAEAKAQAKTVSEELASIGVPPNDLPASGGDGKADAPDSEEALNAALENAKTFEEKASILDAWEKKRG